MKKVIFALSLVTAGVLYTASSLFALMPKAAPTAVIAEKGTNGRAGDQVAMVIPETLTDKQNLLLKQAYDIAKADGHKNPELVQAVLLQETQAGSLKSFRVANPGPEAYFGVMQIKLKAARDVLSQFPSLFSKYGLQTRTDDEIKANLILNDRFNLEVASKYLLLLQRQYGFSGRTLLNAYNRGPGGVQAVDASFHYALGAEQKLAEWKKTR
jgi:hypothetical protein